jgi:hypothetical protein
VTRALTVRLDDADHAALTEQAKKLGLRPGTLARILVHAGLSDEAGSRRTEQAHAAIQRLVERSRERGTADAVSLVAQARDALDPRR